MFFSLVYEEIYIDETVHTVGYIWTTNKKLILLACLFIEFMKFYFKKSFSMQSVKLKR